MFASYDMTDFGKALQLARKNAKLTQNNVKDLTGLHQETLRKMESGTTIPKYETLEILSTLYKVDLLEILISKRTDPQVYDYYRRMDEILVKNSLSDLEDLYREFQENIHSHTLEKQLLNKREIQQLDLFIQCCRHLYAEQDIRSRAEAALSLLEPYIASEVSPLEQLTAPETQYSDIEVRLLFMLGTIHMELEHYERCIGLLTYVIRYVIENIHVSSHMVQVVLKAYTNLAYCYHLTDQHEQALAYANEGIAYAVGHHTFYMLQHLLGRKAVAEYFLGSPNHVDSFKKCLHLMEVAGQQALAEKYKEIVLKQYHLDMNQLM